ncbi:hypothetical protein LTR15_005017 [Elasticomyces elasticus]|nr:hypothetical protein LTR15_005017 [Elasticomyces elasticus]
MTNLKRVDGGFPPITQLSDVQDLRLATATKPSNLSETSQLRQILHGLGLQYSLSRTSLQSLENRAQSAKSKDLQWLRMGTKTYAIGVVDALCVLARASLGSNDDAQAVQPPQTTQSTGVVSGNQPPNNISKRKLSSTSLSANVESSPRERKRQTMANSHERLIAQKSEDGMMAKGVAEEPHATRTTSQGSHAPDDATQVSLSDVTHPEKEYIGAPKPKLYTSKADFEADRALVKHKHGHGLAKARRSGKLREARGDMPKAAHTSSAPDTAKSLTDAFGVDDAADPDLEDDDAIGDGREAQLIPEVSAWHTCTTFRDQRKEAVIAEQIAKSDALAESSQIELWRVSAATGTYHTKGSTTSQHIKPSAAVEGLKQGTPIFNEFSDFPSLSAACRNLAGRLLSTQSNFDQFTSYTTSLAFALVLARRREALGQRDICITRVATREVTTHTGEQAKFYFVPELLDILGVIQWEGLSNRDRHMLMGTRFHHEYVALGELDMTKNPYRPVMFDQLKAHGLYDFRPGLQIEGNEVEEKKLYYRRLQLSHQWYGPETMANLDGDALDLTSEHLEHAAKLARLFNPGAGGNGQIHNTNTPQAHLSIFLDFVGLFRRPKNNKLFAQYVGDTYSKHEVQSILYQGMERLPNNSPDRLQVMDRTHEACTAVGLREPRATEVMLVDALFDFDGAWHGDLEKIKGSMPPWKRPVKKHVLHALEQPNVATAPTPGGVVVTENVRCTERIFVRLVSWYDQAKHKAVDTSSPAMATSDIQAFFNDLRYAERVKQQNPPHRMTIYFGGYRYLHHEDNLALLALLAEAETATDVRAAILREQFQKMRVEWRWWTRPETYCPCQSLTDFFGATRTIGGRRIGQKQVDRIAAENLEYSFGIHEQLVRGKLRESTSSHRVGD